MESMTCFSAADEDSFSYPLSSLAGTFTWLISPTMSSIRLCWTVCSVNILRKRLKPQDDELCALRHSYPPILVHHVLLNSHDGLDERAGTCCQDFSVASLRKTCFLRAGRQLRLAEGVVG